MNSAVGLSFKVVFAEKSTYGSREQCTRPTKKMHPLGTRIPNSHIEESTFILQTY